MTTRPETRPADPPGALMARIKEAPATLALCAVWIVVYVAMDRFQEALPAAIRAEPGSWLAVTDFFGSQTPTEIYRGEVWRTVTSTFIHFEILHLSVNILAMYQFGRMVEEWYGASLVFVFYLVIGFVGNLLAGLARPCVGAALDLVIDGLRQVPGPIGAGLAGWARSWLGTAEVVQSGGGSSVICGWIGLIAVVGWRSRTRFGDFVRRQMISLLAFTALLGLALPFDNYGHACGALVGAALGFGHRAWLRLARSRGALSLGLVSLALMATCGLLQGRSTSARLDQDRARTLQVHEAGRVAENRQRVLLVLRQVCRAYDQFATFAAARQPSPEARRLGIALRSQGLGHWLGELDRLDPELGRGPTAAFYRSWRGLVARALGKPPTGDEAARFRGLSRPLLARAERDWRAADAQWRELTGSEPSPVAPPKPASGDRPARQASPATMPRAARPRPERGDEVAEGRDRPRELAVVAADDRRLVPVARARRPHRELAEEPLGPPPRLDRDVVADQLQGVEGRAVLDDQGAEVLIPAERVRPDDRRPVPPDRREQVAQRDARRRLVQVRKAVDQEVPLPRRDLGPGQDDQAARPAPEVVQLVRLPLVVVLGDRHAVEARRAGRFDQVVGVDHAVGRVSRCVQMMINLEHRCP